MEEEEQKKERKNKKKHKRIIKNICCDNEIGNQERFHIMTD